MSKQPPNDIPVTVQGDWWWYAAFFNTQFYRPRADVQLGRRSQSSGSIAYGWSFPVVTEHGDPVGSITFSGTEGSTTIRAVSAAPEHVSYWNEVIGLLKAFASSAHDVRHASVGPTVDEVIKAYYREKAAGHRVSLKQLAEYAGVSYAYVRKKKIAYDQQLREGNKESNT